MSAGPKFHPAHLRGLLEREARAERNYDEVRAQALLDLHETFPGASDQHAWLDAKVTLQPKVIRARQRHLDARLERLMAEHLLAGHLIDEDAEAER